MLLQGKTALITGATRGIGRATAELFAAEGAIVVLVGRDEQLLKTAQSTIQKKTPNAVVHIYAADVRKPDDIKMVFDDLQNQKLFLHILVNNAGVLRDAMLQMVKPEMIREVYETNVFGTIIVSQYALKSMLKQGGGSIINMSSIVGTNGNVGQTVYASSKSAVIGFTKSLSKEVAPLKIRVNAIAPGFIDTDMTNKIEARFREKNISAIGMRRIGTPEDIASVALFLASDLSAYVTGQTIGVDGGMII